MKRRGRDSNSRCACAHNGFRDRPVQPLRHPSEVRQGRNLSGGPCVHRRRHRGDMLTDQHWSIGGDDGGYLQGGADHRLLDRYRARDRRAPGRQGLDGLRDRAAARVDRGPEGEGLPDARARRDRRGVDAGGRHAGRGGRGRRRRARQQRRLQPERRGREREPRRRARAVRDERVRARAHVPARAAGHARARAGARS